MIRSILPALLVWAVVTTAVAAVDFEREVEPILVKHCVKCHGPKKQEGHLRLDRLSSMLRGGDSGERAIVPGDPDESFLVKLIKHQLPDLKMPESGKKLSAKQIDLITQWIKSGATTPTRYGAADEKEELTHWSFLPIQRPASGKTIDDFIDRRLSENGLQRSPTAGGRALVRRLFLVMHGLPPTPEQASRLAGSASAASWDALIEQVLASPRYGERMATFWLDLVRYGETHGFEMNRERPTAWPYRDWVIDAFNSDKPYDDFVREQIAGDSLDVPMGTGFLVAGPVDQVKGRDPKLRQMQRMNELDDIINTTGTAFLGLTTGCARCHGHKFDPVTQTDYYAMQAVFAGVNHGNGRVPLNDEVKERKEALQAEIARLAKDLEKFIPVTTGSLITLHETDAEHLYKSNGRGDKLHGPKQNLSFGGYTWWTNKPGEPVVRYRPNVKGKYRIWLSWGAGYGTHTRDANYLLVRQSGSSSIATINQQLIADGSGRPMQRQLWSGFHDAGVHDLAPSDTILIQGGSTGTAITADTIMLQQVTNDAPTPAPSFRPPVTAKHNIEQLIPHEAKFVRFVIQATNRGQPCIDELEIFSGSNNVALAANGAKATSSGDFVHALHKLAHINDGKYGNAKSWISAKTPGWVQIELPEVTRIDRIEWARDREAKFTDRIATSYRIESAVTQGDWKVIASSSDRLEMGKNEAPVAVYDFSTFPADEADRGKRMAARLKAAESEIEQLNASNEAWIGRFSQPGPTHRLYRGEPDAKRERVSPNGISAFADLDIDDSTPEKQRRLALADWIASNKNPLTARVIVNRIWQFHFGIGIVDTPSDFGLNGTPPTHPKLLDFLASELIDNDWSLKHIHRLILRSQTWRQDSRPIAASLKVDAAARLLWRFPTRRLEAEGIRDAILAASGVLDLSRVGGPGFSAFEVHMENVRHYHPKQNYGPEDWRRMIYMTKVRQEKDQVFGAFDCPDASMVVPKRSRSTTPLQALNLLNSNFVVQQAELFARRLESECDSTEARVKRAWQLCFQRDPTESEVGDAASFIEAEGLIQFARAVLNSNEFVFIP